MKKFYEEINGVDKNKTLDSLKFEITYVSLDQSREQYDEHVLEIGNWMIVPYGDPRIKPLKERHNVIGVPIITIYDC